MIRFAQVVATHPQRRTVDLVLLDTGLRVGEAHVLSSAVSSDAGDWSFPSVPKPASEGQAGGLAASGRQLLAAVAPGPGGRLCVMGFLHPLGGEIAFTEQDRALSKHSSGAYSTTSPDGSMELWHPSGAYVRVGVGAHEALAPISANRNWTERSDAAAPTITVHTGKLDLTIAPNGDITLHTQGNAALAFDGTLAISSKKALSIHSDADVHITGSTVNLN